MHLQPARLHLEPCHTALSCVAWFDCSFVELVAAVDGRGAVECAVPPDRHGRVYAY